MRIYQQDNPPVTARALVLQETLFHNANGYLGVRGTLEEGLPPAWSTMRGTYLNGVYDVVPMRQAEPLCNLPECKDVVLNVADTQGIGIEIAGEAFSLFSGTVEQWSRTLDMDAGVTRRTVLWRSPSGHKARLEFTRMASFQRPSLFTIECTVTALEEALPLRILSTQIGLVSNYAAANDPRLGSESVCCLCADTMQREGNACFLTSHTRTSGIALCSGVAHTLSVPAEQTFFYEENTHTARFFYCCAVPQGGTLRFVKYTALHDSLREPDCRAAAQKTLREALAAQSTLYEEQRDFLADFWSRSELRIEGDAQNDQAMCFNLYQLLQSAGRDGWFSIAAKGLSGEGYEGHCFWDTEMYMLPFFTLTDPALARRLLHFRYRTLDAARANARLLGHRRGALYPWRTISGRECSGYFPSGTAQYHIDGDIAYAVAAYWIATGDDDFLVREGAEILIETARLWLDVGSWHEGTFRICDVTGPDEYTCIVNNNYYTNACARYNLEWACRAAARLRSFGHSEVLCRLGFSAQEEADCARAAQGMYLPYDAERGINPQDDSFLQKPVWDLKGTPPENFPLLLHYHPLHLYRYQVCKQADTVLAHFLFETLQTPETMRRSYEYYEKVTTHDSSLSQCIFSLMASRLGMREKAWTYFGDSAVADLHNTHGNTQDGIHTANLGGSYMAIVLGFAGLRLREDGPHFLAPFLPDRWSEYRFHFCWRGSRLLFCRSRAEYTVTLEAGAELTVFLDEQAFRLAQPGQTARKCEST